VVSFTPLPLYPPCTHCIRYWVGPRAGVDVVEKGKFWILPELELRPLGRQSRCQSLYRLTFLSALEELITPLSVGIYDSVYDYIIVQTELLRETSKRR
jgi:hypothetical protein